MSSNASDDIKRLNTPGLIKSTDQPVQNLTMEQKVALNRKGNEFVNRGDFDSAKRIFVTTGYSDGLSRIGDHYLKKGMEIEALKMYWLAHNKRKAEPIIIRMAQTIQTVITG